jgi:hypothetical protein
MLGILQEVTPVKYREKPKNIKIKGAKRKVK